MSNPALKFDHVHIISKDPKASTNWYVEMLGATITANTTARGAPQIFADLGGMTILIRGQRPGEDVLEGGPAVRIPFAPAASRTNFRRGHYLHRHHGRRRQARLTDHCGSDSFQAAFPGEFALSTMPPDDRYCVHRQVG